MKMTDLKGRGIPYLVIRWLAHLCLVGLFRVRVSGAENVPPEGGCIIASNHQSYLDPILVVYGAKRTVEILARSSLFDNRFFGRLIEWSGAIPIERDGLGLDALRKAVKLTAEGRAVLVFPEGTRTTDGRIGEIKPAVAMLAAKSGVPVIPAVVEGAHAAWPRGRRYPKLSHIKVMFGNPVRPTDIERSKKGYESFCGRLREAMTAMQDKTNRPG